MTDRTIRRIIRTFQKLDPAQRKEYIRLVALLLQNCSEKQ